MQLVWKQVLDEIEIEVSKPNFLTFFKNTQLISFENGVATISAQTQIASEFIERRYYSLIKRVLDKKTKENVSLIFVSHGRGTTQKKESGPLFAKEITQQSQNIRPKRVRADFLFDTFAVSESNQLAYTAATTVANSPGTKYNPLFIYGTVGVGKTHLMNAIANKVLEDKGSSTVQYLTTEEFTNEVVEAIRDKTTHQLRKKFRNVNLLLLDDIQFLSGKERVQEEIFHTFNSLVDKGHQVVFSSDRPPSEIKKIEARLASRFEGGLTVDVEPPDFELRCAILLIKSKKYGMSLSLDCAKVAAEKILDTRALEGFLLRLSTEVSTKEVDITPDLITRLLGRSKDAKKPIHPDEIIDAVCSFYHIRSTQLKGARRDSFLVKPRHIVMFLLKEIGLTHVEIGNLLGGRDHTTVMHGVEKISKQLLSTPRIKEDILFIKQRMNESFLH